MTLLALIRHMPTEWNAATRLQGSEDVPLLAETTPQWKVPQELDGFRWMTSPLRRAIDTARLLGTADIIIEPRLAEMRWGAWEGETLAGLRARLEEEMAVDEAKGLDFCPPGGESPRDVQARVMPLLAEIAHSGSTTAVTHKGVIRAMLALATGWDMRDKPPQRLDWSAAQLFRLGADGRPRIARLNVPLERK